MADNPKLEQNEDASLSVDEQVSVSRRDFLAGLKKWSAIVIGAVVLGGALPAKETRAAWLNGGGGGGWLNGRGGGGWINGSGGGGGWINNRGGGGWLNRR